MERLQRLRRQVALLRSQQQQIRALEGSVDELRAQLADRERWETAETARSATKAHGRTQALGKVDGRMQTLVAAVGPSNETNAGKNETGGTEKGLRVCDGFGCFLVEQPPPPPPPPPPISAAEEAKRALNGDGDLLSFLIPWDGAWESEVRLDENGTIRAAHDDPRGRLAPHNSYQDEARYPDGYHRGAPRAGVSNFVAPHLFDDAIVPAQAGFNAGMGRHVRVQQASDWERNWCGELGCVDKDVQPAANLSPPLQTGNASTPAQEQPAEEEDVHSA